MYDNGPIGTSRPSVNDGIAKDLCSLHYSLVDKAAAKLVELGSGVLLAKMDIRYHLTTRPSWVSSGTDTHTLTKSYSGMQHHRSTIGAIKITGVHDTISILRYSSGFNEWWTPPTSRETVTTARHTYIWQWKGRKAGRKQELLSLIGSLSHTSTVVRAGRTFLRRLIDLSTKADHLDHFIRSKS